VPFGKREVIYIMQNPRPDSIYGRSPLEVLDEVVQVLVYGVQMHNDFFTNNNMPEGVVQLLGATRDQITQFRMNFENQFRYEDTLGIQRKKFYKVPIASQEVKFTPFQLTSKDMEVLQGQEWWTKLVWMCFGVNASEMGYTESVNKAVGEVQERIAKRKALRPLLQVLSYHINTQLMPEFFAKMGGDIPEYSDVPVEFVFEDYDIEEDKKKHDLLEQELRMGIKTRLMAAKELGIDVNELTESMKQEQMMLPQQPGAAQPGVDGSAPDGGAQMTGGDDFNAKLGKLFNDAGADNGTPT